MAHYLDTSALVKLIVAEPESAALREWLLAGERQPVSSDLARAELMRAVRRRDVTLTAAVQAVFGAITVLALDRGTLERAGVIDPVTVRSLDAVHLASALNLGDSLESIVTYDVRMADAARINGVSVLAPH